MYSVVFTKVFVNHFRKLPSSIQVKTDTLLGLFSIDFRDSRLHTKKLRGNRK